MMRRKNQEQELELKNLTNLVTESLTEDEFLSAKMLESEHVEMPTFGENIADKMAKFGGSWPFISIFLGVLLFWIVLNSLILSQKPFDPYPYILLNLVLSCIAALQAPVIMMSQNRQAIVDRKRARNDYMVNLKAEMEVRNLQNKMDTQMKNLLELQVKQTEILERLDEHMKNTHNNS